MKPHAVHHGAKMKQTTQILYVGRYSPPHIRMYMYVYSIYMCTYMYQTSIYGHMYVYAYIHTCIQDCICPNTKHIHVHMYIRKMSKYVHTHCGLLPSTVHCSRALRCPVVVGENTTNKVVCPPGGSSPSHTFISIQS